MRYVAPSTLIMWGVPLVLLGIWLLAEGGEEGSSFLVATGVVLGVLGGTLALPGFIGQGVRTGMAWVDHDRRRAEDRVA